MLQNEKHDWFIIIFIKSVLKQMVYNVHYTAYKHTYYNIETQCSKVFVF